MKDNFDLMEVTDIAKNAMGGTELMLRRLYDGQVSRETLEQFQIIPTRMRELKQDKFRILYIHDLVEDPEVGHLAADGWRKFHKIVFVSNWQMQRFIDRFQIPWSKCVVMPNAIEPIKVNTDRGKAGKVRLIYHTTPHRGLNILLSVFDHISKKNPNVELDLFSSYKIYGWEQRDEQYADLFKFADEHPAINNHMSVSQDEVRKALGAADIFAYPSIWPETSCLCLIEAMSAGLFCVHPNYGALYETASNWTAMYNFQDNLEDHAKVFCAVLESAIDSIRDEHTVVRCQSQKVYADAFFNWNVRAKQWQALLDSIIASGESKDVPAEQYVYRI